MLKMTTTNLLFSRRRVLFSFILTVGMMMVMTTTTTRTTNAFIVHNSSNGYCSHRHNPPSQTFSLSLLSSQFTATTITTTATSLSLMTSSTLSVSMTTDLTLLPDMTPIIVSIVAIVLLVGAQSFINTMLKGDQGLGAFLEDGSGYNKSGFKQQSVKQQDDTKDPLPWLKLPQLDYVDVAGQEKNRMPESKLLQTSKVGGGKKKKTMISIVDGDDDGPAESANEETTIQELEQLRLKMNRELQEENIEEARRIRTQLEKVMKEKGIEYKPNNDKNDEEDDDIFQ